jgi:hypothetical protein
MKPKKVGVVLFVFLLFYCLLLFFVVAVVGNAMGIVFNYHKNGIWGFNVDAVLTSLKGVVVYGVFGAVGVWIFAKIDEYKRKQKK